MAAEEEAAGFAGAIERLVYKVGGYAILGGAAFILFADEPLVDMLGFGAVRRDHRMYPGIAFFVGLALVLADLRQWITGIWSRFQERQKRELERVEREQERAARRAEMQAVLDKLDDGTRRLLVQAVVHHNGGIDAQLARGVTNTNFSVATKPLYELGLLETRRGLMGEPYAVITEEHNEAVRQILQEEADETRRKLTRGRRKKSD